MERTIDLKKIVIDPTVLIRKLDKETVARYKEATDLPPIDVYDVAIPATGKTKAHNALVLVDGLHRVTASQERKDKSIKAEVHSGNLDQAKSFAIVANLKHGRPLTGRERDEAIRRYSALNPKLDYRALGSIFNCSHMTVKRAIKPSKKRAETSPRINAAPVATVPTGPKAAKAPQDVVHALLTVLQVIDDPTVQSNVVTHTAGATPREVAERISKSLMTGSLTLQRLAARIDEQIVRRVAKT